MTWSGLGARLGRGVVWLTLAAGVGLLLVLVVVPRVGGGTPYTILTGSMQPTYPPGTLVVVRPTPFQDLRVGDVVTFQLRSGERPVVTHRVVGRTVDAQERPALLTQGDANPVPDVEPVIAEQIRGTVWYAVPWLGHLDVFHATERRLAAHLAAVGLLLYAALAYGRAVRARADRTPRGRRRHDVGSS